MGIKHLKKVREYLSKSPDIFFLRGRLRAELNLEAKTLEGCLDYLVNVEKTVIKVIDGRDYYRWKGKSVTDGIEMSGLRKGN